MTDLDSRVGILETWRAVHSERITELQATATRVEGKVDTLLARDERRFGRADAIGWLTRGFVPAFWLLAASGLASILTIHFLGHP